MSQVGASGTPGLRTPMVQSIARRPTIYTSSMDLSTSVWNTHPPRGRASGVQPRLGGSMMPQVWPPLQGRLINLHGTRGCQPRHPGKAVLATTLTTEVHGECGASEQVSATRILN